MKKIELTKGYFTLVDDEDFEYLNQFNWKYSYGYAVRNVFVKTVIKDGRPVTKTKTIRMHRVIMNDPKGLCVDHIDRNKLNNQKSNLRICTSAQNAINTSMYKTNTSGFRGVNYDKLSCRWTAKIQLNNKRRYIGRFNTKEEAAIAYDKEALKLFGNYAVSNFSLALINK